MTSDRSASEASASARSYGAAASALTAVLATSGILTYGFFVLASHALDPDSYGALVILWTGVFIVVSVVFRPVELLLSRTVSEREAHDEEIASTLRVAGSIQLAVGTLIVVLALVFRSQIEGELLDGRDALYYSMLGAVLAYGGAFFGRGMLAGQRRFGLFAALLLIDSASRLAFAGAVAIGLADGVDIVGFGVFAGPFLSLAVIPWALTHKQRRPAAIEELDGGGGSAAMTLGHGSAFAAALFVALLCEQVLLTTGPLFAREAEGTAAAGFMFNILLVVRGPSLLFQAVAASLLPHLTRLRSTGGESDDEAFRLSVRLTLAVVAGFAALATLVVLAIGPQLMEIGFGDKFDYDRAGLAYVAIGMGFYLAAATLNQAAVARGHARGAAICWAVAAIAFVGWNLIEPFDVFKQIEIGFALSSAVLCASLATLYRKGGSTPTGDQIETGSPQEIEATIAAIDEAL